MTCGEILPIIFTLIADDTFLTRPSEPIMSRHISLRRDVSNKYGLYGTSGAINLGHLKGTSDIPRREAISINQPAKV